MSEEHHNQVTPKTPPPRIKWKALLLLVLLLVSPIVLITGWIAWGINDLFVPIEPRPFNAVEWREELDGSDYNTPRQTMVDDLIESGRLDGLTRAEVIRLLGPPHTKSAQNFSSSLRQFGPRDIVYMVGIQRRGAPIDNEWLLIAFDENDVVKEYLLVVD